MLTALICLFIALVVILLMSFWSVARPDSPSSAEQSSPRQPSVPSSILKKESDLVARSVLKIGMVKRMCTWRPSEQKLLIRRHRILRGDNDPTALVLAHFGHYMSPSEVMRYCYVLHFYRTRAEIEVLLEALVTLHMAKRKKSRRGFWVYKRVA